MKDNDMKFVNYSLIILTSLFIYYFLRGLYFFFTIDHPELWPF